MSNARAYNRGFTLVEVLAALFVITIALAGAVYLLVFNIRSARTVTNNLVASGLAQEGIEVMENIRATQWLNGEVGTLPIGNFLVQYDSKAPISLGAGQTPPPLRISDQKFEVGFYQYQYGEDSIFSRVVRVSDSGLSQVVTSVVTWQEGLRSRSVSAEVHLYDWYKQ